MTWHHNYLGMTCYLKVIERRRVINTDILKVRGLKCESVEEYFRNRKSFFWNARKTRYNEVFVTPVKLNFHTNSS